MQIESFNNKNFEALGKIRDAHGVKGEIFLISFSKSFDWLEDLNEVILAKKEKNEEGEWIEKAYTFSLIKQKPHKVGRILKLEGFKDRNIAESFKGAIFYLPKSLLSDVADSFYLYKLKGFKAVFEESPIEGEIISFSSNGAQDLLVIQSGDKEIEVPYVESFVKEIDWDKKLLFLKTPEGLLEINESH